MNHQLSADRITSAIAVAAVSSASTAPLSSRRLRPRGRMFSTSEPQDDDARHGEQRAQHRQRSQPLAEEESPEHEREHRRRGR